MTIEVKVPQLPESVADATLVGWHKKAGEAVQRDENLVDLETDKVVLEVPAPSSGTPMPSPPSVATDPPSAAPKDAAAPAVSFAAL